MNLRSLRTGAIALVIGLALGALLFAANNRAGSQGADQLSLDEYRQRRQDYNSAIKEGDPRTRVELLENFIRKYPNWDGRSSALQILATSLLDSGTRDLERVEALLDEASQSGVGGCNAQERELQVYVTHPELPMAGAQKAIQRAEAKIAQERREAGGRGSKSDRLAAQGWIEKCEQSLRAMQGKLLRVRGDAAGAIPILREAEYKGVHLGIDLFPIDERDRPGGIFPTGRLDDVRLDLALAYETTGDPRAARQAFSRVLGSQLGEPDQELTRALRARLGVELPTGVEVRAPLTHAPELTLADLSGRKHRLLDYRGRVVVLNFWSTT